MITGDDGHRVCGRLADLQLPVGLLLGVGAAGLRRAGQSGLHGGPHQALQRVTQLPIGPAELPDAGVLLKQNNRTKIHAKTPHPG